jgi:hypothetical protein
MKDRPTVNFPYTSPRSFENTDVSFTFSSFSFVIQTIYCNICYISLRQRQKRLQQWLTMKWMALYSKGNDGACDHSFPDSSVVMTALLKISFRAESWQIVLGFISSTQSHERDHSKTCCNLLELTNGRTVSILQCQFHTATTHRSLPTRETVNVSDCVRMPGTLAIVFHAARGQDIYNNANWNKCSWSFCGQCLVPYRKRDWS